VMESSPARACPRGAREVEDFIGGVPLSIVYCTNLYLHCRGDPAKADLTADGPDFTIWRV
jgi:hypothetical protein